MLDADTKRRIDQARDILVGKVPDPKSQVEQITIALIYKFMDDMDAEAEALGGRRAFFAGPYERYGWAKLMRSGLGGHEALNLYAEAIGAMPQNSGIPPLFRDIFKNAFLPYRDPETLRAFLKIIDAFEYDHSERLGDAFEYLLSVLGSQGDAGQFRTPRHIIDFVAAVVDPKKHEVVLDPACGTAGFLISAYKHILKANSADGPGPWRGERLAPDERGRLAANFKGYDISPDMVRLSLVNLYLHGFQEPHIYEYDTLTSEERWNEYADVILANPPFMSPKGGIRPHTRFSVQSKRSEVLFVDYIAEHLTPGGRAGIIVPEGVIFQSQTAYKKLRKMLVENFLVGVISLPSGVFMPYTGVKTSILILDRIEARRNPNVMFSDVREIGFSLGAKRTSTEHNDLPQVLRDYRAYYAGGELSLHSWLAPREAVLAGDVNLTGTRYRPKQAIGTVEMVRLGEMLAPNTKEIKVQAGVQYREVTVRLWGKGVIPRKNDGAGPASGARRLVVSAGQFVISKIDARNGACGIVPAELNGALVSQDFPSFDVDAQRLDIAYLGAITNTPLFWDLCKNASSGTTNRVRLHEHSLLELEIPLPPLEVQQEIAAEIEGYQKVIDGARAVVAHYRPRIPVAPDWPMVALGEAAEINPRKSEAAELPSDTVVAFVPMAVLGEHSMTFEPIETRALSEVAAGYTYFRENDVLLAKVTPCFENGKAGIARNLQNGIGFGSSEFFVIRCSDRVLPEWVYFAVVNANFRAIAQSKMTGTGGLQRVPRSVLEGHRIPLPPLETQRAIVAEIEAEQALVNANRALIARMERKIRAVLARVWGEQEPATA